MPLSRRQFELGIDQGMEDVMRQTYYFLMGSRELAYSEGELVKALGVELEKLYRPLEVLVELGAAEEALVEDTPYYTFGLELDTNTWKSITATPAR